MSESSVFSTSDAYSPFKHAYFVLFIVSAVKASSEVLAKTGVFASLLPDEFRGDEFFVRAAVWLLVGAFALHLARVYLMLELLEDVSSAEYAKYLRGLAGWRVRYEQALRFLIILVVSLKVFTPSGRGIGTGVYFLTFYALLLAWDVNVIRSETEATANDTFWKSSFFGLVGGICVTLGVANSRGLWCVVGAVILAIACILAIFEGFGAHGRWGTHFLHTVCSILRPPAMYAVKVTKVDVAHVEPRDSNCSHVAFFATEEAKRLAVVVCKRCNREKTRKKKAATVSEDSDGQSGLHSSN